MSNSLFRQEAIDKIESPERLNEMINITSSRNWIILFSIIGIFAALILWSIFGQIPYSVKGQGILLQAGGVHEVVALSDGEVDQTFVEEGKYVSKGDIIALIEQPELKLKLANEEEKLKDYMQRYDKISQFGTDNLLMKQSLYEKEKSSLQKTIKSNRERISFLADRIKAEEELLAKGLITKETLNNTKNQYFNVQQENESLRNDLIKLQHEFFQSKEENEIEMQGLRSEILAIQNNIREMKAMFELNSIVLSPVQGKIIEIMVNPGKVINAGSPIASIEPQDIIKKIEAIIYVNPRDGKRIKPGMSAKVSPSTIKAEEYGYILGEITKVSEYPATHQGMFRTLGNEELVQSFLTSEPPIAVTISLIEDKTTYSGFKWSSIKGPRQEVKSGTICSAKIVIETKRPISLLFPQKAAKPILYLKDKLRSIIKEQSDTDTIQVKN